MAGEYSREFSAKVFNSQSRLIELGFRAKRSGGIRMEFLRPTGIPCCGGGCAARTAATSVRRSVLAASFAECAMFYAFVAFPTQSLCPLSPAPAALKVPLPLMPARRPVPDANVHSPSAVN
jgi:hypothetical protein